ncbi:MAG: dienelactone hydrolase family protein [Alphaproteobacteria bacterium]|nr:dienelactone hydrolase family protein [Alphaproteobacteria bacterium]
MKSNIIRMLTAVSVAALLLAACGGQERYDARMAEYATIQPTVDIRVPLGAGPFPAVVLLHNCAGIEGDRGGQITRDWAGFLIANGYAVVMPDSFVPRGLRGGVCERPGSQWPAAYVRGGDAYVALRAAQADARIDGRRIAVMGGSNGGVATLAAANADMIKEYGWLAPSQPGFVQAISFYPECGLSYGTWQVQSRTPKIASTGSFKPAMPVLILIGSADNWTPASSCEAMLRESAGQPIEMKIYPGAHHGFDTPSPGVFHNPRVYNSNNPSGGATTGQNPAAREDSRRVVLALLGEKLARK